MLSWAGDLAGPGGRPLLIAATGVGVSVVVAVLMAVAIINSFDGVYRRVLELAPGGLATAFMPFRLVAITAAALAIVSGFGAAVWPGLPAVLGVACVTLVSFLGVWTVAGCAQLVLDLIRHATNQERLLGLKHGGAGSDQGRRSA